MKRISTIGEETIFSGNIFQISQKSVKFNDSELFYEIARRSPGVRLLIIEDEKMLVTKEYRVELDSYDYRLPGGKVFDTLKDYLNADSSNLLESAISSCKKEAKEEAGIIVKNQELYCMTKAGGTIEWDLYYFIVKDFMGSVQELEDGEIIEVEWKPFDEVKRMCIEGEISEDRTVGVLLKFFESFKK